MLLLQLNVKFVVLVLNQLEQHLVNVIFHYFPLLKLGKVPELQTERKIVKKAVVEEKKFKKNLQMFVYYNLWLKQLAVQLRFDLSDVLL